MVVNSTAISKGMIVPTMVTSSYHLLLDSISGDLTIAPPVASSLDFTAPFLDVVDFFAMVCSQAVGVLGDGCGVSDFLGQRVASLVEEWTIVKGKKVRPSTPFDTALRSQKLGMKGKA